MFHTRLSVCVKVVTLKGAKQKFSNQITVAYSISYYSITLHCTTGYPILNLSELEPTWILGASSKARISTFSTPFHPIILPSKNRTEEKRNDEKRRGMERRHY